MYPTNYFEAHEMMSDAVPYKGIEYVVHKHIGNNVYLYKISSENPFAFVDHDILIGYKEYIFGSYNAGGRFYTKCFTIYRLTNTGLTTFSRLRGWKNDKRTVTAIARRIMELLHEFGHDRVESVYRYRYDSIPQILIDGVDYFTLHNIPVAVRAEPFSRVGAFDKTGFIRLPVNKVYEYVEPDKVITRAGIDEVNRLLMLSNFPYLPEDFDNAWVVNRGKYAGTFPKRVAQYIYKEHGKKVPSDLLGTIGSVVHRYGTESRRFIVDFTNKIDWDRGDFGDDSSCYWTERSGAKTMLINNGAYAIRLYDNMGSGMGRAWVIPNAPEPGSLIVFNGYKYQEGYTLQFARILAGMLGLTYKEIRLYNNEETDGVLWINGGKGFIVGGVDTINNTDEYDLGWDQLRPCWYCEEPTTNFVFTRDNYTRYVCRDCVVRYADDMSWGN